MTVSTFILGATMRARQVPAVSPSVSPSGASVSMPSLPGAAGPGARRSGDICCTRRSGDGRCANHRDTYR